MRVLVSAVSKHAGPALLLLLAGGVWLRWLLVTHAPTPFGYVWDFYVAGVRVLAHQHRLPVAADCWQCYHPPVFYLLGWPLYEFGRRLEPGPGDAMAMRAVSLLALGASTTTIYYGYRLLRLFRCRGASLVHGVALLVIFPCLFISSYGAEADIVLTAILSAFTYHVTRYLRASRAGSVSGAAGLGALAGLAAATKYSGLVALVAAVALFGLRALVGPHRRPYARNAAVLALVCCLVGAWPYVHNLRTYGNALQGNGSASEGLALTRARSFEHYDLGPPRLGELRGLFGPQAPKGTLTSFPVYASVTTTLHALAWSDMSFFSEPSRHGDPSKPYPAKEVPPELIMTVVGLGFVPESLALLGFVLTLRRRSFRPLAVLTLVGLASYLWWFLPQPHWALKTKYILFLLPGAVLYAVVGLSWVSRRLPIAAAVATLLVLALVVLTHVYLYGFAVGEL